MNLRHVVLAASALSLGVLSGCGSSDDDGAADSAEFRGVYLPTTDGPIGSISFTSNDYTLMPKGCSAESCTEIGTYTLDPARTTMTLSPKTGASRTIAVQVLKTSGSKPAGGGGGGLLQNLRPLDQNTDLTDGPGEGTGGQLYTPAGGSTGGLTNPGNNGLVDCSKSNVPNCGQTTTGDPSQLLERVIEAALNGQGMKNNGGGAQNPPPPADNPPATNNPPPADKPPATNDPPADKKDTTDPPPPTCGKGIPTTDSTQQDKDAYLASCPCGKGIPTADGTQQDKDAYLALCPCGQGIPDSSTQQDKDAYAALCPDTRER
jgi:hypothetical protein